MTRLSFAFGLVEDERQHSRKHSLSLLAERVAPGDANFKELVLATLTKQSDDDTVACMAQDPLFEMTWGDLDDDNKQELQDIIKAMNRTKACARSACTRS